MNGHRYADDLEGQNDEAIEGLSAKVKLLKDVSESSSSPRLVWDSQCLSNILSDFFFFTCFVGFDRLPSASGTKCESPQYSSVRWYIRSLTHKSNLNFDHTCLLID